MMVGSHHYSYQDDILVLESLRGSLLVGVRLQWPKTKINDGLG